jgi:isoamylase
MRCFGMVMDGRAQPTGIRRRGEDATMLMVMNGHYDLVEFTLPEVAGGNHWALEFDTNLPSVREALIFASGDVYRVASRSLLLFSLTRG